LAALLLTTPLFAACAFLMDFDELQKGNGGAGGSGQTGGRSGQSGGNGGAAGGAAGADASADSSSSGGAPSGGAGGGGTGGRGTDGGENCPSGCADTDPCTVDACTTSGCTHTYTPGVFLDGLSDKATLPEFHRVTIAVQRPNFYLSALASTTSGTDVVFYGLNATDANLSAGRELSKLGTFNGRVPVSAAGMASTTNGLVLNVFVAMGQQLGQAAQVWELTVDPAFGVRSATPAATDDNYAAPPTAYPVAWSPSGTEVYAAWPGATSGVFMHRAGSAAEGPGASPALAAPGGKVTHVAPLSAGVLPGVLFVNSRASVQVFGQLVPISLGACDATPGTLTQALTTHSLVDGIWLGGWTKTKTAGGWVSELKPVLCGTSSSGVGCLGSISCQAEDAKYDGIRNPAFTFVRNVNGNDAVGRVYEIMALPYVNTVSNEAGISLQMLQVDFDTATPDASVRTQTITTTPISIVTMPPGANNAGPDLPAMAFLEPHHLAIAWIQPGATAGQELHVERHRVCFPR
jgi:hypothetical protein